MGADLAFDIAEDVHDEHEKIELLWKAWHERSLRAIRTEYDSDDDNKKNDDNDDDDDDALLTQVPDFVYDFHHHETTASDTRPFFMYRVRRWISHDLQTNEAKQVATRFADAPVYSWRADAVSYLSDYVLSDDLVVVQNASLLHTPTRWKWLQPDGNGGLDFIRDSGFFGACDKRGGIHGLITSDATTAEVKNILQGVCAVGECEFRIGMEPNEEQLDLYGIIRVDVLSPALLRFPFYNSMRNLAITPPPMTAAADDGVVIAQLDCQLPVIQNCALWFNNAHRYRRRDEDSSSVQNMDMDTVVAMKIDLQALFARQQSMADCWTIFLSFSHPIAQSQNGAKSMLLFKKNCVSLAIETEYNDATRTLLKEELVLKIFSKNKGNRFVEIFRKKIRSSQAKHVNTLIVAYNGEQDKKLFASLNGRQLSLNEDEMNRTNLFNLKKTRFLLVGHKCATGDSGETENLFNGYMLQFAIYPTVFREFELRAFQQQCSAHIEQYCNSF